MMQRGFTLLELIIASGIFAGVMLISFAVVGNTQKLEGKTIAQRSVEQTTRFAVEHIGRHIRVANGLLTRQPDGEINPTSPSFTTSFRLLTAQGLPLITAGTGDIVRAPGIEIGSTDLLTGQQTLKQIILQEDHRTNGEIHRFIALIACEGMNLTTCPTNTPVVSLTPADIEVTGLTFGTFVPGLSGDTQQPFVEIALAVAKNDADHPEDQATHEVRTTITTRNLGE